MGRSGSARRAFWQTDRSVITEGVILSEGRTKAAAVARAEREIAASKVMRGLRNPGHIRHGGPWKPFSPKTPTSQKVGLLCSFCGKPPRQGRNQTMAGWWRRRTPAPGMSYPAGQDACPTCKKQIDKGRELHPVL